MKPKGRTTRPTPTRPLSTPRGDTTTQTRRRSTISKLDRPGETGGDAGGGVDGGGCGGGAVGALCLTASGYKKAWGHWGRDFWEEEKKVESRTGMAKWWEEALLSLLSDPSWTAGAYFVQFNYFTDNFVPCSISFVYFLVFSPPSHACWIGLLFFFTCSPWSFVAFGFQRRFNGPGVCLCVLQLAFSSCTQICGARSSTWFLFF